MLMPQGDWPAKLFDQESGNLPFFNRVPAHTGQLKKSENGQCWLRFQTVLPRHQGVILTFANQPA